MIGEQIPLSGPKPEHHTRDEQANVRRMQVDLEGRTAGLRDRILGEDLARITDPALREELVAIAEEATRVGDVFGRAAQESGLVQKSPDKLDQSSEKIQEIRVPLRAVEADGSERVIGESVYRIQPQQEFFQENNERRVVDRVVSWEIRGVRDGRATSFNVMRLVSPETAIFIYPYRNGWHYGVTRNYIFMPAPDSPTSIAIGLHEIGHEFQYSDERYVRTGKQTLNDYARIHDKEMDTEGPQKIRMYLESVGRIFPETKPLMEDPSVQEALGVIDSLKIWSDTYENMSKHTADFSDKKQIAWKKRMDLVLDKRTETYFKVKEYLEKTPFGILMSWPTRVSERDATARAFTCMRRIRKETNVNLFVVDRLLTELLVSIYESAVQIAPDCVQDLLDAFKARRQDGSMDLHTQDFLKINLATYKAGRAPQLLKRPKPEKRSHS